MKELIFNLKHLFKQWKYCWAIGLSILVSLYFNSLRYDDKYVYLEDITGFVETLPSTGNGDIYRNVFSLRLSNGELVKVDTPAFLGMKLNEEVTVKVYVNSKNSDLRKYQYIPPENVEPKNVEKEECFAPCKPTRVGR